MKWVNKNEEKKRLQVEPAMTKKKKPSLSYIFGGGILTGNFITKQSKLLILIFCLIIVFISNRYYCTKKLTEMDNLKKELDIQQSEKKSLNRQLTVIGRQQRIEELLKESGINLTKGNATIYQIQK